jgi:hypothetical protein
MDLYYILILDSDLFLVVKFIGAIFNICSNGVTGFDILANAEFFYDCVVDVTSYIHTYHSRSIP